MHKQLKYWDKTDKLAIKIKKKCFFIIFNIQYLPFNIFNIFDEN